MIVTTILRIWEIFKSSSINLHAESELKTTVFRAQEVRISFNAIDQSIVYQFLMVEKVTDNLDKDRDPAG